MVSSACSRSTTSARREFALHWIRAEIHEYVLRNWRLVKIATTKAQRKLFFNLRRFKKNLGWLNMTARRVRLPKDLGVTC